MDPSEGSIPLMSVFRIREFFLCTDPDAYPGYFLVWGDYRCPRPGLDFYSSFRSETPVLNPRVLYFCKASGSVNFLWILNTLFFSFLDPHPFQQSKYLCTLLTLLPCVIARDQGGGGGRRRQRRRRRGLRGGGGGGGGGRHPRGRCGRGGSGRGRVRGEVRLDSKVWTPLSSPGTPLLLG